MELHVFNLLLNTCWTSNIRCTLVGNKIVITQMQLEQRLSALLQLHFHSRLNTWLQRIPQRQLQGEMRNIYVFGFGVAYIRGLMEVSFSTDTSTWCFCFAHLCLGLFILVCTSIMKNSCDFSIVLNCCDALCHHGPYSTFGSGNGLVPDSTKPLPEPILTYHR